MEYISKLLQYNKHNNNEKIQENDTHTQQYKKDFDITIDTNSPYQSDMYKLYSRYYTEMEETHKKKMKERRKKEKMIALDLQRQTSPKKQTFNSPPKLTLTEEFYTPEKEHDLPINKKVSKWKRNMKIIIPPNYHSFYGTRHDKQFYKPNLYFNEDVYYNNSNQTTDKNIYDSYGNNGYYDNFYDNYKKNSKIADGIHPEISISIQDEPKNVKKMQQHKNTKTKKQKSPLLKYGYTTFQDVDYYISEK